MDSFSKDHKADYVDLFREFEVAKRNVTPQTGGKVNMKVPVSLNEKCVDMLGGDIRSITSKSDCAFRGRIQWMGDKMRLDADIMKGFFREALDSVINHIREIRNREDVQGLSLMLLVGGFSDSPMIQDAIKQAFQDETMRVLIPHQAGLSVLMGAVVYGHNPEGIESRIMRYSYGVDITPEFVPGEHPESKKVYINGKAHCNDVFSSFMEAGTLVEPGHTVVKGYSTMQPYQELCPVRVYFSLDKSPKLVSDPLCHLLGELAVHIPIPTAAKRQFLVRFEFGDTELRATAVDLLTRFPFTATFKIK
jgi:hypothetical protein